MSWKDSDTVSYICMYCGYEWNDTPDKEDESQGIYKKCPICNRPGGQVNSEDY